MSSRTLHARRHRFTALAAGACLAFGVAACGSDDDASDKGSAAAPAANASSASGVAEAKKLVAGYTARPTKIPIDVPVGKPIPEGKTIVSILCGLPSCKQLNDIAVEGAKVLGWKIVTLTTTGAPESVKDAWSQAVKMKPDGVIASGFDKTVFASQLKELEAANIPVVENSVTDDPGDGIIATLNTPRTLGAGKQAGAYVVADTEGKGNVAYFDLPAYIILKPVKETFLAEYKRLCPDCKVSESSVPLTAVGKNLPSLVVSYLRANPDVNYAVFPNGSMTAGVPAALKAAGLTKVKVMSTTSGETNLAAIAGGQEQASIMLGFYEMMWLQLDALARHFVGVSVDPVNGANMTRQTITKDTVVESDRLYPLVADYDAQYKRLWGKQ